LIRPLQHALKQDRIFSVIDLAEFGALPNGHRIMFHEPVSLSLRRGERGNRIRFDERRSFCQHCRIWFLCRIFGV